jgi:hypothetical protein
MSSSATSTAIRIRWVAEAIHAGPEFTIRAQTVARELGASGIAQLAAQLHSEHSPPAELQNQFPRLGQWMAARQFAIFEVLYWVGPSSLPLLRQVAFGEYDWTQGNAIEILCRLAADGVECEVTIEQLRTFIPSARYEALVYAAGPLMKHAKSNPELERVVRELLIVPAFAEVYNELSHAQTFM